MALRMQAAIPLPTFRTRPTPRPCVFCSRNLYHSSPSRRLADNKTHYDTLNVKPGAPPAEIKKAFYALSKTHHPDRNPNNQAEASKRFVAINDAYAVLGHESSRAKYDREVIAPMQQQQGFRSGGGGAGGSSFQAGGSYTSPAGGRKASGLSRRRSAFRGPPPSFYRSGGWGEAGAKREANASRDGRTEWERMRAQEAAGPENGTGGAGRGGTSAGATAGAAAGGGGGAYAGQQGGSWPFSADPNDVPHFDRDGHFRTQSSVEEQLRQGRRKRRALWEEYSTDGLGSEVRAFGLVGSIILVGIGGPLLWLNSGKKTRPP